MAPYRSASSASPWYRSIALFSAVLSVSAGASTRLNVIRPRFATYGCEESGCVVSRRWTPCVPLIPFGRVRLVVPPEDQALPVTGSGTVAYGVPGCAGSKPSR